MKKFISLLVATQWLFFSIFPVLAEDVPPPSPDDQNEELQPVDELPQDPDPEPLPDPTPPNEEENVEELPQDDPVDELPAIRLNEVLADPIEPEAEGEFIELYNFGDAAVDLSGWRLDDENLDDNLAYHFNNPDLDYILEPDSFLTIFRPETGITLNNDGDAVHLFDANDHKIDAFVFDSTSVGRSWGRSIDDPDDWILFPTPTPDAENVFENHPPVADIHVQGGTGGMKLNVTGEASADPDGDKLTYLWEFEPGQTSTLENPATYTFLTPGNKEVTLTVTDEFGATGEMVLPFLVVDPNAQNVPETPQTPSNNTDDESSESSSDTPKTYPKLTLINEILADPLGADGDGEWVELYNSTDQVIDLSGWYLDDEEGASAPFQIPEGAKLAAKSYVIFQGPDMNLSFKNSADVVRLLDPNKTETQRVDYVDSHEGLSYAKNSEGEFVWTPLHTPGKLNAFPPPPQAYAPDVIRFESVLPNPKGTDTGKEKIVLKNASDQAINLAGWIMAMGSTEKVLPNIQIPANGKQELTSDQFSLTLKNTDGILSLYDPTHQLIDQITWKTAGDDQWLFNTNSLQDGMMAKVVEVVDGDTFKIIFDGRTMTVRLLGVDTPETVHPFKPVEFYGKQASDHLKTLLTGQSVRLEFDENKTDTYGRILAYIYLDDVFVNKEILLDGFGYAYTRFPFRYLNDFLAYQAEAKAAGRGLWADPEVSAAIEKTIQEDISEPLDEVPQTLVDLSSESSSNLDEEDSLSDETTETEADAPISSCDSTNLKIDSFIPSPKSGEPESITLINRGDHEICLEGWSLDDVLDGGSKPYQFTEGRVGAGEKVSFNKEVTKLSLNNSDDCVTLMSPQGETVDQICYEKTHEGEVFTHDGGDWTSSKAAASTTAKKTSTKTTSAKKTTNSKTSTTKSSTPKYAFSRESSSYRTELTGRTITGKIIGMDEQEKMLVVQQDDQKIVSITYGSSLMDMKMLKSLVRLDKKLVFDVYDTLDFPQLISVHDPDQLHGVAPKKASTFLIFLSLPVIALGLLVWKKRAFFLLLKSSLARRLRILKE